MCLLGSITNCNVYTSSNVCLTCADTYEPSLTGSSCNLGSINNC